MRLRTDEVAQTSRLWVSAKLVFANSALVHITCLQYWKERFCGAFLFLLSGCVSDKTKLRGSDHDGSKDNIAFRFLASTCPYESVQCTFFASFDACVTRLWWAFFFSIPCSCESLALLHLYMHALPLDLQ
jgi:hypothetical protein